MGLRGNSQKNSAGPGPFRLVGPYSDQAVQFEQAVLRLIIIALLLAIWGCDGDPSPGKAGGSFGGSPAPVKVFAQVVQPQRLIDEIQALGTARANESVEIKSPVPGLIINIAFKDGQFVEQGELLVELENDELRAELAVAEATFSESRSIYERSKSLIRTDAIAESRLEQLQAAMNADDARVDAARARLANTRIRTPFSGRIGLRRISPGDFVDSSVIITTLDDTRTIKVDFSIPGTFLSAVTEGMTITARSTLYPETEFSGLVRNIDTRLDPIVRAIQIRAELPNDENLLKPGMLLTVKLQQDRGNVLIVPEESIVPARGEQFVYLVESNRATKRKVMLGRRLAGLVEITTGLKAGDTVVTDGAHKIRDGMLLEILSLSAADASNERTGSNR